MADSAAEIRTLTDFSKQRPLWLRSFNALGRPLERLVRLDEEGLLEAARRRTGLSDFGPDDFRAPFSAFMRSLERERP